MQERLENLKQAKALWEKANNMLEKNKILGYIHSAFELHNWLTEKKLSPDDLRPMINEQISLKAINILREIWTYSSNYSTSASTSFEQLSASMVNRISAFFMDCKLEQSASLETDETFNLGQAKILIGIMQFMPSLVKKEIKEKGRLSLKAFMDYKINAIRGLENPNAVNALGVILKSKGPNLAKHVFYDAATTITAGRFHALTVSIEDKKFENLKGKYKNIQGDALKTEILIHFKNELAEAKNLDKLNKIATRLEQSDEYKLLKIQQGIYGRIFDSETSSVKAFKKMIEQAKEDILHNQQDNDFKI